ncbi:MAG: hypothetical protein RR387_04045 [Clostridiales bacterium]
MKKLLPFFLIFLMMLVGACGKHAEPQLVAADTSPAAIPDEQKKVMIIVGALINSNQVNIRSVPSVEGEILGKAHLGQMFKVTEQNAAAGWHEVIYQGKPAYINGDYLYLSEWDEEARLLIGTVIDVENQVNIRNGTSLSAEIVGMGKLGATFIVRKENYAEGWHQIDLQGSAAYISSTYLKINQTTIKDVLVQ